MNRTVTQVAEELGLNRCSVAQMLKRINAPKLGTQYIIDDELFEYIKSRRGKQGEKLSKDKD